MLQRLIHSARVNVFESARFYYWVLIGLAYYFLLNRLLQKISFVYLDNRWVELKVGEGFLFGLVYVIVLISAGFLRKKIPAFVLWCWSGLVLIFLINEFRFAWGCPNYSLLESLTKSQGYYTAKLTMPMLFWGVWSVLKNANHYGTLFINQLRLFLTLNAFFIISGAVFSVSLFESYPLSGRWGYSGLLWHLNFHFASYGVFLIYLLQKRHKQWVSIFLFGMALTLLGQKAGVLYLMLIFVFVLIKNNLFRSTILIVTIASVISSTFWMPYVVTFTPFWKQIYDSHGAWGVVFSLRNESVYEFFFSSDIGVSLIDWILGGHSRYPLKVEMMPFDILLFSGFLGVFLTGVFIYKMIPSWSWSIPILVACFSGGIYEAPLMMMIYFITLQMTSLFEKKKRF